MRCSCCNPGTSICIFRIQTAEKQYQDAFEDEYKSLLERVRARAIARHEEAKAEVEEEERLEREVGSALLILVVTSFVSGPQSGSGRGFGGLRVIYPMDQTVSPCQY